MTEIDRGFASHRAPSGHRLLLVLLLIVAAAFLLAGGASSRSTSSSASVHAVGVVPAALGVPTPTTNTSALDLGGFLNASVNTSQITGGSGNVSALSFFWHGLPTNCTTQNSSDYTCVPTVTGAFSVSVTVVDNQANLSATSSAVSITINTDPVLTSFSVSATSIGVGGTVTFTANASGGTAPLTFVYSGLPAGCAGNTSTVSCTPNVAQTYNVSVYVMDSAAMPFSTDSRTVTLDVTTPSTSSSPAPTALDWAVIAIILIVGFSVTALLLLRARREEKQAYATQRPRGGAPPVAPPKTGGSPPSGGSPPAT